MANNKREFDLEERTYVFARNCRLMVRGIPKTIENIDDCRQLVKASGSVSANYIEANEALSRKDLIYRIKICRKESKESKLWLRLLAEMNNDKKNQLLPLLQEADELRKIFSSILNKSETTA
jgi:four helix bundle protein